MGDAKARAAELIAKLEMAGVLVSDTAAFVIRDGLEGLARENAKLQAKVDRLSSRGIEDMKFEIERLKTKCGELVFCNMQLRGALSNIGDDARAALNPSAGADREGEGDG